MALEVRNRRTGRAMLQRDAPAYRRQAPHTVSTQGRSLSSGFKRFCTRVSECRVLRFEIMFYSHDSDTTQHYVILQHACDIINAKKVVHKDKRLNVS